MILQLLQRQIADRRLFCVSAKIGETSVPCADVEVGPTDTASTPPRARKASPRRDGPPFFSLPDMPPPYAEEDDSLVSSFAGELAPPPAAPLPPKRFESAEFACAAIVQ